MVTSDVDHNLRELESMPETIAARVRGIPPAKWETPVWQAEGGWNRRQLLAHLASINLRQTVRARLAAGLPDPGGITDASALPPIDDWNMVEVSQRSGMSIDQLLEELRSNRSELVGLIRSFSPQQRAEIRISRGAETMSFAEWVPFMLRHDREHLAEIVG
ncbi:MAG TPA: DinB family protein [Dehalococcoidia bacterium]|nr:DinB family protein [Dehalococcoidia bacterium]